MSVKEIEVKDSKGGIRKAKMSNFFYREGRLCLRTLWSAVDVSEIRQGQSDWYAITNDLFEKIKKADGDVAKAYYDRAEGRQQEEQERRLMQEAKALQRQEAKARAISKIEQLKAKCASGEWSLVDLQHIFHLVSQTTLTPYAATQDVDELSQAQNDLIDEVIKNPSLTEPIKLMYAKAQFELQQQVANSQEEMQQQILDNLEQLSSNQAQGNTILKQNQKSGKQRAAIGLLGGMVALNKLGDIDEALGDDE